MPITPTIDQPQLTQRTTAPGAQLQTIPRLRQRVRAVTWERKFQRTLMSSDALIVFSSVFGAQFLRFGNIDAEVEIPVAGKMAFAITYTLLSVAISLSWLLALSKSRDPKVFGVGPLEYKRVIHATLLTFGLFAILSFGFRAQVGRGYLLIALPVGLFLLVLTRRLWRKMLHRRRREQRSMYRTLIVGERRNSAHIAREITRNYYAGFGLVGAVTQHGAGEELLPGLPIVCCYDGLLQAVDELAVDTLIMTSADSIEPSELRHIGWELAERGADLIMTFALTDIAAPRMHTRPISGLPLIHVEHPEFTGRKQHAKRIMDVAFSGIGLAALTPLMLLIAALVRIDSRGPALFKQRRVGQQGREFFMLKFRSMVVDAEAQLPELLANSDGSGLLFKMKRDPRVTRVGRFLRKYSLDELPQLINVLRGEMSLVGPRPPLPSEVESYERWVHRRLLVKPGITGLWQVSGRSDLPWEESVRLDLYYVENWSMIGDLIILWRTLRTVLKHDGAY